MLAFVQFKLKNYACVHELLKDLQNEDFSGDEELQGAFDELQEEFNKIDYKVEDIVQEHQEEWMDIE